MIDQLEKDFNELDYHTLQLRIKLRIVIEKLNKLADCFHDDFTPRHAEIASKLVTVLKHTGEECQVYFRDGNAALERIDALLWAHRVGDKGELDG